MNIKALFAASLLLSFNLSARDNIRWINPRAEGAELTGHGWKDMRSSYNRLPAKDREILR